MMNPNEKIHVPSQQPSKEPPDYAVCVRHAYKQYGSKKKGHQVLIDLNMTVERGSIYGLLGASGCGKTTLLSCIIGRKALDKGAITVLGGKPGSKESGVPGKRCGYMPQELALCDQINIKESMMYFGWIYNMKNSEIKERIRFLLDFLNLPSEYRLVKNLSGGQQRRVSLAIALVYDPELLILDEPTVGVDPLLRENIWKHLVDMIKDGNKTIIITTHYIEEARLASRVGLMRSGCLLAEHKPSMLLGLYKSKTLEDVFLELCTQKRSQAINTVHGTSNNISEGLVREEGKRDDQSGGGKDSIPTALIAKARRQIECRSFRSYKKFGALLNKNFLRIIRNVNAMMFIFMLPVTQVILFCLCIGKDPVGLNLAIVNLEVNYTNKTYQECPIHEGCIKKTNIDVVQDRYKLSCQYINRLNNDSLGKVYYPDLESGKEAVRRGRAWGVMYFNKNYTKAIFKRTDFNVMDIVLNKGIPNETLDDSEVNVWLDMSSQQISIILKRDIRIAFRKFSQKMMENCGKNPKAIELPVTFQTPIYGSDTPTFTDFVAPGVILTIVFFLAVGLTATILIQERTEGLLERSYVAGVTSIEVLFSHIVTQFILMCGQTALVLFFMIVVFNVTCVGSIHLVIFLALLQGLCGMGFGFVISTCCDQERVAIQTALGSFYPIILLSGVLWPVQGMTKELQYIAYYLPLTLATTSMRSILTRGWDLTKKYVYYGYISTVVWITIFLTVCILVMKLRRI